MSLPLITERETVLLIGQAYNHRAWLKHLAKLLGHPQNRAVQVQCANGGTPNDVLNHAKKIATSGYDKTIIVIDANHPAALITSGDKTIQQQRFVLINIKPSMESLLLHILEPGKNWLVETPTFCRKYFETNFIPAHLRSQTLEYDKYFTTDLIKSAAQTNQELAQIIGWMTNTPLSG